jgi:hypothetical protein
MRVEKKGRVVKVLGMFTVLDEEDADTLQRTLEIFYVRGRPIKYIFDDGEESE